MNDRTQINSAVQGSKETSINNLVNRINATVLNQAVASNNQLVPGTLLSGKYEIICKMDVITGEADLYVCRYQNRGFVAKMYRREIAIKDEVVQVLKKIDSPYVSKIYETGAYNGLPFEILPYYKNGSLQGKRFTLEEFKNHIIPSLNEGLHVLHSCKILHKDLKPSNIMLADNGKDVALIDFGISSMKNDGNTVIVTKTGMTPEYSAPETFRNLYLEESDYYSLGITLFELFCGYTPYKNMNAEAIEQYVSVQRIPFPESMPNELKDFIASVTYYDITNRKNKKNPNRRWTYEEVKRWCNGEKLIIPGEGIGNPNTRTMPPYTFLGKVYTNLPELVAALASNWKEGKKQLFRGLLSGFFKGFNPEIAGFCIDAEEEAMKLNGKDDYIFWKLLYKLYPDTKAFNWQGNIYQGLPALGRDMLERLWKNDNSQYAYYGSILSEKLLSTYAQIVDPKNNALKDSIMGLESSYQFENQNDRDKQKIYYLMAYMLSGQKLFHTESQNFRTVGELSGYMKELLDDSYEKFENFCHSMIDYEENLDVQLESWLIALGKRKELEQWRAALSE